MPLRGPAGQGWLALLGGGEFSFGETLEADRAWLAKTPPGPVGFLPTASGSADYGRHLAAYLGESFERELRVVPVYRPRDARRGKNVARIDEAAGIYLGGGVTDHLLEALAESPVAEALGRKLGAGGTVAAIAAAAQALGVATWSLLERRPVAGLGWLPGGVVETNFDPGHDRRLRKLMGAPGAAWGLGLPAGAAVLLGPEGAIEIVGTSFLLEEADGDYQVLE